MAPPCISGRWSGSRVAHGGPLALLLAAALSLRSPDLGLLLPRALQAGEVQSLQRDGHVALRGLLQPEDVQRLRAAVLEARGAKELDARRHALRTCLGTAWDEASACPPEEVERLYKEHVEAEGKAAFLQYFNLWRESDIVAKAALAVGAAAAALLAAPKVRLYSDALFVKRPGDQETAWHMDLEHVPLETSSFVTLWIPLQPVPAEEDGGSPLQFWDGTHHWASQTDEEWAADDDGGLPSIRSHGPLGLGDATAHLGHTMHAAPELGAGVQEERVAIALSFFEDGACRRSLPNTEDEEDEEREAYEAWLEEVPLGAPARHQLLPEVPMPSTS